MGKTLLTRSRIFGYEETEKELGRISALFFAQMGATLCINQTKRTWIGHNFKKRSSLRGPFIHTVELFPCSRKQLRSEDRGGSRPYRWEADETNMWRGDGIEVHGCDGVEHLALVHDAVTRHWSSKKKRS